VRHRTLVVLVWLVALIGFAAADQLAGSRYTTQFQLPDTPSAAALTLLQRDFPAASGDTDQIVLHATTGTVRDPAIQTAVTAMLARVSRLPHVQAVTSPYGPRGAAQISRDGTVAFATVSFDQRAQSLPVPAVKQVITVAQAAQGPRLQVALGGQAIEQSAARTGSSSTAIGVVLALLVLGFAFGALFAAFLPLVTALAGIGIGFALTGLLTHVFAVASFATVLGVLIGLGVGVDYALFIVTRHRTGLRGGRSVEDAAASAVSTAGRAVLFAGLIVCIALLGQFALGVTFLYGVAVTAAITVTLTMLSSLTLLPALLGFIRLRALSRRERARLAADGPVAEKATGFWARWAAGLERRPLLPGLGALALVVLIALPVLGLRLGLDDAGSDPAGSTTRLAYDLLARGFGPGFSGPFQLVAELPAAADAAKFPAVLRQVAAQPGVAAVTPPVTSPDGRIAVAQLYPATSPQAQATSDLLHGLRDRVIPRAQAGTGMAILVGGPTAIQDDFATVLAGKLPLFIGVVVVLAFLLLVMVFRSLLIPLVASVMNLLSVGAALGLLNVVFGAGWGDGLLGLSGRNPVEVFVPVLLFSILFGLSMDYEVFLVSRMHEHWLLSRDNRASVTLGQAETGRVITAAATIMILVFLSFLFEQQLIIDQFGVGLAGAVIVDAFLIRTVLVPAAMHLSGTANWWLPRWLDRVLPQLSVDPPERPGPAGLAGPEAVAADAARR
jgi:RND superfamily putative drug exporter